MAKLGDGQETAAPPDSTPSTTSGGDDDEDAMWGELMEGAEVPADARVRPTDLHLAAFRGDLNEVETLIEKKVIVGKV